jgi:protein-tyrosine phosphatase
LAYWLRYCYSSLGGYSEYRKIRWSQVRRLVFVCRGNICRSPYAEYWAKARGLPAASLGVDTVENKGADVSATKVARHRNISLQEHRTTPIERFNAEAGDLLIGMEPAHLDAIERQEWTEPHQVTLLGLWIDSHGAVIVDPYGSDEAAFDDCFSLIEAGINAMGAEMSH